jgi:cytoskeletal protein CcmA (bactofilin family)
MDRDTDKTAETVVGPSVKIQGDLNSEGNIRIEGAVTGKVKTTQNVYIGDAANLTADVHAGSAVIAGIIQGNLKIAGNLTLQKTARIHGDITCAILRVEDGAQFTGKCNMGSLPSANGAPAPEPTKGRSKASVQAHAAEPEPEE